MPDPRAQTVLCPILIGRDAQVAALTRLLNQTHIGQGQIALLSGEAGIGKSRLAAEVRKRAAALGFTVWQVDCFESDRVLPYAPLVELLRTASNEPDLPSNLLTLFPGQHAVATEEPQQVKRRLFAQFTHLLLAHADPKLIVVEDLQWCDDISLEFLLRFTRELATQPICLLLTYRNDERYPPLAHFLAEIDRWRLAHEFALARLEQQQVTDAICAIFQQTAVRAEFADALYDLTDGNPFFVEEVLKSLVSAGDIFFTDGLWTRKAMSELRIPRTVEDAVQRRLQGVSSGARRLLTLAAVVGRRCPFLLLQHLSQQNEADVVEQLKELVAAQLMIEEHPDRFAFRHALTRQAIYSGLLGRERKTLHRTVLQAMEAADTPLASAEVAALAHHAWVAEDWGKTLRYAQMAGEQALALFAPQAALKHLTQALAAAEYLQQAPPHNLHRARGRAYGLISDFANARQEYLHALSLARAAQDTTAEWQCLIELGTLAQEDDYQQAGDYFQAALALARSRQEPTTLAYALVWLGRWHSMMDQPELAWQLQTEALTLFQSQQDETGMAITLSLLGWSYYVAADLYASAAAYQAAVARCRKLDQRQWLIFSLAGLAMRGRDYFNLTAYWPPADPASSLADAEEAIQLARQIGYRSGEARAHIWFAMGLGVRGDYGCALAHAQTALQIAQVDQQTRYIATVYHALGALYLDLLALPAARQILAECLKLSLATHSATMHRYAAGLLAAVAILQGRLDEAQSLLDHALPVHAPTISKTQRLIGCTRAELCLARQQPDQALAWVERLLATAVPSPVAAEGEPIIPRLWHLRGEALLALNRPMETETVLQTAYQVAAAEGMRPLCWRIQASLARLYQRQRRQDQALAALTAAQTTVTELSLTLADERLRQNFVEQAQASMPALTSPTPLRAAKLSFAGLTLREREVAALIAQGKTNGEIAALLVISERTVAKHVENCLGKLGFSTRTQIAAWAVEKGLLSEYR